MSVHLAASDDLPPLEDLVAAPLACLDGLHDDGQAPPRDKRHL